MEHIIFNLINQIHITTIDANLIIGGMVIVFFGMAFKTVWEVLSNK